jgi:hypothetical protein
MQTIPTVRLADFERGEYASRCQPCLIVDGLASCERLRRWTPEYLAAACGDTPVDVEVAYTRSESGATSGTEQKPPFRMANIPFREAARWITAPDVTDREFYVPQELVNRFPRLRDDITFGKPPKEVRSYLWFGTANARSVWPKRLHADPAPNMFAQVWGQKQFILFSPDQVRLLYPRTGERFRSSPIDPVRPDLDAYPRFAEATPIVVTLNPGDILFLPSFWWHHVTAFTVSISVSQWWRYDLRDYCNPTGARLMTEEYLQDGWAEMLRRFNLQLEDLIVFAEQAAAMDQAMAALALSVLLDYFDRWPGHRVPMPPVEADVRQAVERLRQAVLDDEVYAISQDAVAALAHRVRHDSALGTFARAYRAVPAHASPSLASA